MDSGGDSEDLFGRWWTYEELEAVDRTRTKAQKEYGLTRPAHWPLDTEVDPGKWVFWLPDGWGQGQKATFDQTTKLPTGKRMICYIGPPPVAKRFFHKPKVAEYCAKMGMPGLKEEEVKEEKAEKIINVHTANPPAWPDAWETPLPLDWRLAWRKLPTTLHKIYIPPGQDEAFCYHRTSVEEYLANGTGLSLFETSKTMEERSAAAGTAANKRKKRKRYACPTDYEQVDTLKVINVTGASPILAGVANPDIIKADIKAISEFLSRRGFAKVVKLLLIFESGSDAPRAPHLHGIYFEKAEHAGHPYYQHIHIASSSSFICSGLYIFWNPTQECWKVGLMDDTRAAYATCACDSPTPAKLKSPWLVMKLESMS